jgi:hypothetical protein
LAAPTVTWPLPVTVGLAQKSDADGLFKLMDANVTSGNLRRLVTDKPSPITVGLQVVPAFDEQIKTSNKFRLYVAWLFAITIIGMCVVLFNIFFTDAFEG